MMLKKSPKTNGGIGMNVLEQPPKSCKEKKRAKTVVTAYERNMTEVFESLELVLFEKIKQVDHVLYRMSREASASGVPKEYKIEFLKEKLLDIVEQVAERREGPINAL